MPEYIPAEGEFVFVVKDDVIQYPGKTDSVDHSTRTARIQPVGEPHARRRVPFTEIRRHPLSTQRNRPEES